MIWSKEDVDNFLKNDVLPPDYVLKGFCGGGKVPFIAALSIAIDPKRSSKLLLEALKEKYPEAVEKHMQEAEELLKKSG